MKIFVIVDRETRLPGYPSPHAKDEWLILPDSTLMRSGKRFYIPDFDSEFRAFPAVCYRIDRLGKTVAEKFAGRYVSALTAGFVVVAAGKMEECRITSSPWTDAMVFDGSSWLGEDVVIGEEDCFGKGRRVSFSCGRRNEELKTVEFRIPSLKESGMDPAKALSMVSARNTLKIGDMLMILLPGEGFPLAEGMSVKGAIDGQEVFTALIK